MLRSHLDESATYAKKAVKGDFEYLERYTRREQRKRSRCVQDRTWYISQQVRQRMRDNDQRDLTHVEPSILALDAIPHIPLSHERAKLRFTPRKSRSRHGGVVMRKSDCVPRYDAWIPVQVNYWVGKQLHLEPYMPFLGDQDNECEAAFEVYEDMAGDAGKDSDLSDGELTVAGKFVVPRSESDRIRYYSMADTRWREATRKAVLSVLDQFEKQDDPMWRILATALGIKSIQRVKAIARVAQERREEYEECMRRRKVHKLVNAEIAAMRHTAVLDTMPDDEEHSFSSNALKHFCFTCHTLPCPQHEGVDVLPILPIEDLEAKARQEMISKQTAPVCSASCALSDTIDLVTTDSEWSAEEIILLREAVPIFGLDPCSIAVVIGSRSCLEVSMKLDDPLEADIAQHEIEKAKKPRRLGESANRPKQQPNNGSASKKSTKGLVDVVAGGSTIDQDFSPCEHAGPCTINNCNCVRKGMHCETTCGCNFGRFGEGGLTGGIVWKPPSKEAVSEGLARDCLNRHYGCTCEDGNCSDSRCPCWEQYRACNPDWCKCDAGLLPGHLSREKRCCRNIPVTTGSHKRTFIGKSDIHGFGLFAGERFEVGDLVGIYSGQLIDTRLADMIGRIYDATNRTYIFNVTEALVIDGGLLGSKAKFCNHTTPGNHENCHSRMVRVRGAAHVALLCKRAVNAGEEFLFDYRFTGEVPGWAKEEKGKSKKSNS